MVVEAVDEGVEAVDEDVDAEVREGDEIVTKVVVSNSFVFKVNHTPPWQGSIHQTGEWIFHLQKMNFNL